MSAPSSRKHGRRKVHKLLWKPLARSDLLRIVAYIAQDNPDAAEKLANDIEAKTLNLKENPKLSRVGRLHGTRELVLHPNYLLIYRVLDDVVEVLRVKHCSQRFP